MKNNMLEYKGFYGSVEYSMEDECFFGRILGITDLVTFEGDSIASLKKVFHEMVDDYIIDCETTGKKVSVEKYDGIFNVIISPELHKEAALIASKRGISLNDFVKKAIVDELYIR